MSNKVIDITGKQFGYLVVLRQADRKIMENGKLSPISWICLCQNCGTEIEIPSAQLRANSCRTSCGCIKKEYTQPARKKKMFNLDVMTVDESCSRRWGPCPYPSEECILSKKGWCCVDCDVKNCEDRCKNTPHFCGCKRLKKG